MLLLGIDVGTSSIKVSVVNAADTKLIASARFPETEATIISQHPGWAEQEPESWWQYTCQAIQKLNASGSFNPRDIAAIGIAYQMHGLVIVDKNKKVLRPSIIWCDSRAVETGNNAFEAIGPAWCREHLLNSPGNFTASKLAWVKAHEPAIFEKADKLMLPGDYIAMRLTQEITTSPAALSEGVLWDFQSDTVAQPVMDHYGFSNPIIPRVQPVFSVHGAVTQEIAVTLGLKPGIPVSYKAGDQPNNALSLNVMNPGEIAATAGTSGVIYAVSDRLTGDPQSRVNSFAHVNHTTAQKSIGVLLCINGTGIMNRWMKDIAGSHLTYAQINEQAANIPLGSNGLTILPFGNGAERMLGNKLMGSQISNLQLTTHQPSHLFRAAQEGIACAFRYGLDILKENGVRPSVIRAGKANMFLSPLFTDLFVNFTGTPVELYENDGAVGAAIGAGIGAGIYTNPREAFQNYKPVALAEPNNNQKAYASIYERWKGILEKALS
ncbi:MAG TPA: FGGY family carbohydrate kinase [Agriterribacter sp.]|uniref:xylulokinase n=1 Tax=Agriterribacter sp. TaxID=2821509 RepID=UPI002BF78013|nr:FGGY family carbohydrate kinase [Agriterribacter sp.]HRQ15879.1 FGGY family carbohydrate kinase [Agriterribacter sp.]